MKDVSFEKCDEVEDAFEMNDINEEPSSPLPTNDKVKTSYPALQILQCVLIRLIPSHISNGEHDFQEVTLTPLER